MIGYTRQMILPHICHEMSECVYIEISTKMDIKKVELIAENKTIDVYRHPIKSVNLVGGMHPYCSFTNPG